MNNKKIENKTDDIIIKFIGILLYCGIPPFVLVLLITLSLSIVNSNTTSNVYMLVLIQQSLPVLISYGLIPILIFIIIEKLKLVDIGLKWNKNYQVTVLNMIIVIIFMIYLFYKEIFNYNEGVFVLHYFCVALAEEILVRGIILYKLSALVKKKWVAIVISAFIFALVFHSTDGIIMNIVYRVPFGIITAILYKKTDSLMSSITFHWIYNVALTINYI